MKFRCSSIGAAIENEMFYAQVERLPFNFYATGDSHESHHTQKKKDKKKKKQSQSLTPAAKCQSVGRARIISFSQFLTLFH